MDGTTVAQYRIVRRLGAGGMGVVYLAEDTRLNRRAALKFLPPSAAGDAHAASRLLREAQTASALDHPNVATIFEVGEWQGQSFIAMAFYEGETLKERLDRGALPVDEAIAILQKIATGLAAAHRAGIVHRDLKPANTMLLADGQVKILDFGLASVVSDRADTMTRLTQPGTVVGTLGYMAPEQINGAEVGPAADVWALGVIAYEMLTGRTPFSGHNAGAAALALMTVTPEPLNAVRADVPEQLAHLVAEALEKMPERRTLTAADFLSRLEGSRGHSVATPALAPVQRSSRPGTARLAIAAAVLLAIAVPIVYFVRQSSQARWAREQALPEIQSLIDQERYVGAFQLAAEAKRHIPTDPAWARIDSIVSRSLSIDTTPPGATVSYRQYGSGDGEWVTAGQTPLKDLRVPTAFFEWKAEKAGLATAHDAAGFYFGVGVAGGKYSLTLPEPKNVPEGMILVSPGDTPYSVYIPGLDHLPPVRMRDFWIDRYEVTNRQFKQFVDAGGYRNPQFWKEPFVTDGVPLAFDQAIARFTDTTGRTGPATWESGTYPDGQEDFPVGGVSWYEAAAYAAFAGKSLPTISHWSIAAEQRTSTFVVPRSNFGGRGTVKVGSTGGMNRFGAFDMAGNVKEWCWNRADDTKRYVLGGAWDEPIYMFNDPDARSPFDRPPNVGFRTVKYSPEERIAPDAELIAFNRRDFRTETPVSSEIFDAYRRLYAYDKADLKSSVESVDDSSPEWRIEKVSYDAAYGGERVPALVYIPKNAAPPYQAVVYYPGSQTLTQRSTSLISTRNFDWIMKSGRVLIHPVLKSTFERGDGLESDYPNRTNAFRDHVLMWSKDVGRTVDYLESRPDVAKGQLAYFGASWGAAMGPIMLAVEPRFKSAVLAAAGLYLQAPQPEVDAFNFAPHVRTPTLMLNGRFDFFVPTDSSQEPMFRLLGVQEPHKRRVVYETGHNIPRPEMVRETLDWLDRYLGPAR